MKIPRDDTLDDCAPPPGIVAAGTKDLPADLLEISAGRPECVEGRVRAKDGSGSLSDGEVVRRSRHGNLLRHGTFVTTGRLDPDTGQGIGSTHWHHAAACEVEAETEIGKVDILRFHAACFAGRVINPRLCELQIEGSVLFGLGQALFEEMLYDEGQLSNPNLSDYMIASFKDVPGRLTVSAVEHPGAGEVHGIGETSVPPVMPCVANAVYNAVGVRITDLPLTPEKVLRALRKRRAPQCSVRGHSWGRAGFPLPEGPVGGGCSQIGHRRNIARHTLQSPACCACCFVRILSVTY